MDANKREQLEQKGVLALLVVFVLVLGSTLKGMGIIGGSRNPQIEGIAEITSDLPGALQKRDPESMIESFEESLAATSPAIVGTDIEIELPRYAYSALDAKDPLRPAFLGEVQEKALAVAPASNEESEQAVNRQRRGPKTVEAPEPIQLEGILWGGDNPRVVVSGEVYGVGDRVEGAGLIVAISRDGMIVSKDGQFFRLNRPQQGRDKGRGTSWEPVSRALLPQEGIRGRSMAADEPGALESNSLSLSMPNRLSSVEDR